MFEIIFAVLAVIAMAIIAVLAVAATKPGTFIVERAVTVDAPPERIFPLVSDLRRFATWSPYEEKDPDMKRTYSGAASGKGASYEWDGNKQIGKGRLEIADASAPSRVTMKLDFIRPFECHNVVDFTLEPKGESTIVTWAMHGPVPYMAKIMHVIFNMDRMVGKDFEAGLSRLKAIAERQPAERTVAAT
ncbi:MAG: SRPBCC family protein [Hyphomicrobiaceae bacterium]|nr:MAG: SRPBCC family protein [Hyphomicrobiaceae bacterium]